MENQKNTTLNKMEELKGKNYNWLIRLTMIKNKISQTELTMTGYNSERNYYFFNLKDILPTIQKYELIYGITTHIEYTAQSAILKVYDAFSDSDKMTPVLKSEISLSSSMNETDSLMQILGGAITYARRYHYISLYNIVEPESIDSSYINNNSDQNNCIQEIDGSSIADFEDQSSSGSNIGNDYDILFENSSKITSDQNTFNNTNNYDPAIENQNMNLTYQEDQKSDNNYTVDNAPNNLEKSSWDNTPMDEGIDDNPFNSSDINNDVVGDLSKDEENTVMNNNITYLNQQENMNKTEPITKQDFLEIITIEEAKGTVSSVDYVKGKTYGEIDDSILLWILNNVPENGPIPNKELAAVQLIHSSNQNNN